MPILPIDELPAAPDPATDTPQDFSDKAAAMVLAQKRMIPQMNAFGTQANVLAGEVNANAVAADASAQTAQAAMQAASAAADATPWVSGKIYQKNNAAISQINFQTYRRTVAGSGTTDPADDAAGIWTPQFGNGSFTPRPAATATFDLSTGNYFTKTMSASETWVFDKCPSMGFGFTVELAYAGGTLTLPSTVRTPFNAPVSLTAGKTYMLTFFTSNKGVTRWRLAMIENFDN